MSNIANNVTTIGRLTSDPVLFKNQDGSRRVRLTVAARNNFTSRDGSVKSQFVSLTKLLPADRGNGAFDYMHEGDLIGFGSHVESDSYQKNGETIYVQTLEIDTVDLSLESKAVRIERFNKKQAEKAVKQAENSTAGAGHTVPQTQEQAPAQAPVAAPAPQAQAPVAAPVAQAPQAQAPVTNSILTPGSTGVAQAPAAAPAPQAPVTGYVDPSADSPFAPQA